MMSCSCVHFVASHSQVTVNAENIYCRVRQLVIISIFYKDFESCFLFFFCRIKGEDYVEYIAIVHDIICLVFLEVTTSYSVGAHL